jgi:hypothetical protein
MILACADAFEFAVIRAAHSGQQDAHSFTRADGTGAGMETFRTPEYLDSALSMHMAPIKTLRTMDVPLSREIRSPGWWTPAGIHLP